jgi:uncharacterized protein (TIGR02271 family)
MMITLEQVPAVLGHPVYDISHSKVGTADHVYLDRYSGEPAWLTVRTGLFGSKETFVPIESVELSGDEVLVPYSKDQIKNAPPVQIDPGEDLQTEDEMLVYEYYDLDYAPGPADSAMSSAQSPASDDAMTRSEERLRVGREDRETGRVRLRKYVTVEQEQHTIPVRRERVRVEREPITDDNRAAAMAGPEITEAEHEVILHEERPVVATETVPVERVRLEKETVVDEETVSGQVRKEHIEMEGTEER